MFAPLGALAANEMIWIRKLCLELGFALGKAAVAREELKPESPSSILNFLPELEEYDAETNEERDLKYALPPSVLGNDNMGTTQTVNNPETNWKNKFLDTRHFKVRDYIRLSRLIVAYIPTDKNVADFFTKALIYGPFNKHRTYLGITA